MRSLQDDGGDARSDTRIDVISIDAQAGTMRRGGNVVVRGEPQGRFHMDAYGTQFRIVTFDRNTIASRLSVIDVSNLATPRVLGTLDGIGRGERLYATRFDGDKAYVVTFRRTDPLWVISLAVPTRPQIVGELIVPGWSDFIFPRGDHLVTVGRSAVGGAVQVSLFDVSDPRSPRVVNQLALGTYDVTDRDWPTPTGSATVGDATKLFCDESWESAGFVRAEDDRRLFRGCYGAGPAQLVLALFALLAVRRKRRGAKRSG